MDVLMQGVQFLPHAALGVGGRKISEENGIRTPFGNDCLAYVSSSVVIEMGRGTNELQAPVLTAHAGIASWGILQVAMGAEMDDGIGLESALHIEIGSQIAVWRCHLHAMH